MELTALVKRLREVHGDGLVTVVLYGSAAAGEHHKRTSDYNVLVIVRALDFATLAREAPLAKEWARDGNPPPLTFTEREWRRSADIFPMEYADILERHKVLYGDAPFDGVVVKPEDLRLQLEHQVAGKLLQFRQGVLLNGGKGAGLTKLLEQSLSTFMVLFRATLRLHGEQPPTDYVVLSERVGAVCGIDSAPFVRVARHIRGEQTLAHADAPSLIDSYLAETAKLKAHLDRLTLP
jgi:predicted nucleotidyltransferase